MLLCCCKEAIIEDRTRADATFVKGRFSNWRKAKHFESMKNCVFQSLNKIAAFKHHTN